MFRGLLAFLSTDYTPPTYTPWVTNPGAPKSAARPDTGPILENPETNTWRFHHGTRKAAPVEAVSALTPYDLGLLAERKQNNLELAARLKVFFAQGITATEMAKAAGCAPDTAKKFRGTFTAALSNERGEAKDVGASACNARATH